MSLLNKLGKMADKVQKKANELVDASARAAQHKVNSLRDNKELRDITVESKALPGVVQGFVRLLNAAGTKLEVFLRDYCGVPEAVAAQMTEIHNRLHAATVASTQHLTTFTLAMEEILKAEQAVHFPLPLLSHTDTQKKKKDKEKKKKIREKQNIHVSFLLLFFHPDSPPRTELN
eukprot:comp10320_c0_seq4/m.12460 comp10320_c0_seq4/g.12460  ORF comp10320_c0_seq4/g.12460 comp10320_c0_seq4/m.12460 type:complete len:175 (-) comp10320_c0_seq4:924-1448(-)